jgi:hypothetical protein
MAAKRAAARMLGIAQGYQSELARINEQARRGIITAEGAAVQRREARQAAQDARSSEKLNSDLALRRLEAKLAQAALPRVPADREALARAELDKALSAGVPEQEAIRLAASGSREVVGVLLSSYGTEALKAAGVRNIPQTLADVKRAATGAAIERSTDAGEIAAAAALARMPKLRTGVVVAHDTLDDTLRVEDQQARRLLDLQDRELEARYSK